MALVQKTGGWMKITKKFQSITGAKIPKYSWMEISDPIIK